MNLIATYDRAADHWEKKIRHLGYEAAYATFFRRRAMRVGRVLDVGTGSGAFAGAWIAAGGSRTMTLLDSSPAMLAHAERGIRSRGVSPEVVHLSMQDYWPSQPFGAVLAAHVLEHSSDPQETLRRFADWLEPGGRLFLVASKPHWCNWLIWLRFRHRWFRSDEVVRLARAAGLALADTHVFDHGPPSRTSLAFQFIKTM